MARAIRSLCDDVGRQRRAAECSDLQAVSATSPPPSSTVPRRRRCRCRRHPSPSRCSATPPLPTGQPLCEAHFRRRVLLCSRGVAAPVLLGVAAVGAREAPVPTPRGRGWSRHPTAKPVDAAAPALLLLPSSRWIASANSTARSSAGRHRRRRSRRRRRRVLPRMPLTAIVTRL
jgi:hypothetical protein